MKRNISSSIADEVCHKAQKLDKDLTPSRNEKELVIVVPHKLLCTNLLDSGDICDSPNIDKTLFDQFGATVCSNCRANCPDRFKLLTQTEILSRYLLTVKNIAHLKYLLKENPVNRHYTSMKLFLKSQIDEVVLSVWKSEELLELEIAKRQEAKFQAELKKVEETEAAIAAGCPAPGKKLRYSKKRIL